jgi:hypothetical protein
LGLKRGNAGERGSNSRPVSHRGSDTMSNNQLSQKFKLLG